MSVGCATVVFPGWTVRGNERSSVSSETVRCTALVDGKPVGFSIWSAPRDRTATGGELTDEEKAADAAHEAELEATKEAIDIERDAHWGGTFWKGFKKAMEKGRKARYAGQPYWLLEILAVNPAAQGLGVGKALLAWGFERADKDQLPIYLEATVAGKPVYERSLFEAVGDIAFAGSQPGTELSLLAMERPPQPVAKPSADVVAEAKADDVVLSLVDDADWPEVIRTKLLAMVGDPLYETSAPVARRPDFETQVSAYLRPLSLLRITRAASSRDLLIRILFGPQSGASTASAGCRPRLRATSSLSRPRAHRSLAEFSASPSGRGRVSRLRRTRTRRRRARGLTASTRSSRLSLRPARTASSSRTSRRAGARSVRTTTLEHRSGTWYVAEEATVRRHSS